MDYFHINSVPKDPRGATKYILDLILNEIHPQAKNIKKRFQFSAANEEDTTKIREIYTLCLSQIKKCLLNLFEVFRLEFGSHLVLQESRQCALERLSWCFNRLISIDQYLQKINSRENYDNDESSDNSFNVTVMYFVNWIDHAFEILKKLADIAYKTEYKENDDLLQQWKSEIVECVSGLHLSIDELLLSAMTLCRYCLPSDQLVVKARSQVVLRETKALLTELINGDLSTTVKATTEALKMPIKPSNVNVMIDVLKDVLYILETNTNTALLTLLVHCFSNSMSPVEVLRNHFAENAKGECSCEGNTGDISEDCVFVKDFDLYNERLLQIGSFAVSCSSDQNRILTVRSGLASLEALDPHLVPALMTSPHGCHSSLLLQAWQQEVRDIRDNVFLIVDPAAFADKSKQMMHQKLLEVLKDPTYNNENVCSVINIGCVVSDFFEVYNKLEPDALAQHEILIPMLADLSKAQLECKIVSNLLCISGDFAYEVTTPKKKDAALEQLHKRLKLLYTLVTRINRLLQPKDNDQLFEDCDDETQLKTLKTQDVVKNGATYLNSPKKANLTRSIFARTSVRSSTRNFPLSKLTKHLRGKNCSQLNFSVELDRLFNVSEEKENGFNNKCLNKVRETSILYNFSPIKNRSSMRKVVLSRHLLTFNKDSEQNVVDNVPSQSLMNEYESLQLTEVLNELHSMTSIITKPRTLFSVTQTRSTGKSNILRNNDINTTFTKQLWNIPVSANSVDNTHLNETTYVSNMTQPSTVTTLERISDLDFVETKLNSLKSQYETSL